MSAELGTSEDPEALVPGDPSTVAANARALQARAGDLRSVGDALRRVDTGAWTGPAFSAWSEQHRTDVPRWWQGAESLDAAAAALGRHAETLSWAQREAGRAAEMWRAGQAATATAQAAQQRAVADADARNRANAAAGDPAVVAVPPFSDPGQESRQAAREILDRARAQLWGTGDDAVAVLRTEAAVAPQDSQKQADLNFYGGLWDSVSGAATGAVNAIADPVGAVVSAADAVVHPVDTAKTMVAWDDWAAGRGDVALGKVTGGAIVTALTAGAGKVASTVGRDRVPHPAEGTPDTPGPRAVATTPEARAEAARGVVLDSGGKPFGVEDSKRVFLVDEPTLNAMHRKLRDQLGEPDTAYDSPKGRVESWSISTDPKSSVTYRTHSRSGGAALDVNGFDDLQVKRFHLTGEGS